MHLSESTTTLRANVVGFKKVLYPERGSNPRSSAWKSDAPPTEQPRKSIRSIVNWSMDTLLEQNALFLVRCSVTAEVDMLHTCRNKRYIVFHDLELWQPSSNLQIKLKAWFWCSQISTHPCLFAMGDAFICPVQLVEICVSVRRCVLLEYKLCNQL